MSAAKSLRIQEYCDGADQGASADKMPAEDKSAAQRSHRSSLSHPQVRNEVREMMSDVVVLMLVLMLMLMLYDERAL